MGFLDSEHVYAQRLKRMAASKADEPFPGAIAEEALRGGTAEERSALSDTDRKQSSQEDAKSSNPVVRAWGSRDRGANVGLVSMVSGGAIGLVVFWIVAAHGLGAGFGVLAVFSGILMIIGLYVILKVPPICPGCDEQLYPMRVGTEKIGESRGYGTETRVANTYSRGSSYDGPSQQTTYTVSYPTLIEHFRNYFRCPNCGYASTNQTTRTHRVG